MKFIRFGDSLLNLEQVVCFQLFDLSVMGGSQIFIMAVCATDEFNVREHFGVSEEAQARFKELSDYLVGEKHLTTKSGGEPQRTGVMRASQALNVPDIVGKRIAMSVMDDFGILKEIKQAKLTDDIVFEFDQNTVYADKNNLIEVID